MAATAVLRSQDCLRQHHPHRETHRGITSAFFSNKTQRSRRRKRSPTGLASNGNGRDECGNKVPDKKDQVKNIVMGQVKILKRGEPLPDLNNNHRAGEMLSTLDDDDKSGCVSTDNGGEEMILSSTGRLGPDPDMVQKQIRASDFYAGSGPDVSSPHPSSLPFPALLAKKEKNSDEATMDLLRLLRLDLP